MGEWLGAKLGGRTEVVAEMLSEARFVYDDLRSVAGEDPYLPHTFVWFHRDLRDEVVVPGEIRVVHRDERILVIDKPAFLSTIPRGRHVQQSVVVRLRDELGLPELSPLHRLDRITSGLLLLATEKRWRGAYQVMFEHGTVRKTYRALAPWRADLELPQTVRDHLRKVRGTWQGEVVPGAPVNAETLVELEERVPDDAEVDEDGDLAVYRLTPRTGRTHQLRLHLHGLGIPIMGDPLYPVVRETSLDDFSRPLQLLAAELAFTDPVDGSARSFASSRSLPIPPP
ncbi:pseudouridylate synthase [Nocardioides psychrotolerans]|uniref:RNA pseudouridylate synthase n=1 Tax=Nocardioides psychrotolerans TaxID=1005945 RepID=A0A1I3QWE2_9ACTN|nr:pseudouridine synthase [Nocardioides psychrotolerans]GEP40281.1 pseudouridylate synthase [Nocardioides psychrotolerans]SFJ38050.1 tRNA pseudouridine32 synthase / 23S rRNA pseudouridine746 synthase [Nocardioides psychrotolerans]